MKQQPPFSGMAAEPLHSFDGLNEVDFKLGQSRDTCNRDARHMAALLDNMQSGMDTFVRVFIALKWRHGQKFKNEFYAEVHRNG